MCINVRTYTLSLANGVELGKFTSTSELGNEFVAHFGKGYRNLANKLVNAIELGKDTTRMERVLGVHVTTEFVAL